MDIDSLWDYADPEGTEKRFREILPVVQDESLVAELHTQIARTFSLRNEMGACLIELERAESLINGKSGRAQVRLFLERGRMHNSSGQAAEAVRWFELARAAAEGAKESGLEIDAIHMLAIADKERSYEWNLLAIAKAEQSSEPAARRWLASLYNNMGWTHLDRGEAGEALEYFERAVPLREQMGDVRNLSVARWSVARALRELARHGEALDVLSRLLADDTEDGHSNQEMALNLVALGRKDEATTYASRALQKLADDPWMKEHRPETLAELERISRG